MKYIGNFKEWITEECINYLLHNDGTVRPNTPGKNPNVQEFIEAERVGYDMSKTWWHIYEQLDFPIDIKIPFDSDKKTIWWFIKMTPGGMMPIHRDPHVSATGINDPKRYWMALQDYVPGHIFVYKNFMITDYKAGDIWMYTDPNEIHGACNISYVPRLTFQFTTYEDPIE